MMWSAPCRCFMCNSGGVLMSSEVNVVFHLKNQSEPL
jgi:hypothetical protein